MRRSKGTVRNISAFAVIALMLLFGLLALGERKSFSSDEGIVQDATGQPVRGAIVFILRVVKEQQTWNMHGFSRHRCARVDAAITNSQGRFELDGGRVSIPDGWDFESFSTQYHVVAKGYRPATVGDTYDEFGQRVAGEQARHNGNFVLQPAGSDLLVSPYLAAALQDCEVGGAELSPALAGFVKLFELANLETDDFNQRKWLNDIGRTGVAARFEGDEMPAMSQEPTNEQLRILLTGKRQAGVSQVAFREAVIANDVGRLHELSKAGIDVNFDDGYRRSRRALALEHQSYDAYRWLRENGAHWRAGEAVEMLYQVAERGDVDAARLLVEEGIRADVPVADGRRVAFIQAAAAGHAGVLRLLLGHDLVADVDARLGDYDGTALQEAYEQHHLDTFRVLLEFGADPDTTDLRGQFLFALAVEPRPEYALALLEHGTTVRTDARGTSLLTRAIQGEHHALIDAMLKAGFTPGAETGISPLAAAASKGWQDMVRDMLRHPTARPGSQSWWHALWITVIRDRAMFDLLLEGNDAFLSKPPANYGCISCAAAAQGKRDIVELLLARGLPVDVRAHDGETALIRAARNAELDMVKFLLQKGADPTLIGDDGITALAYAADGGNRELRERRGGVSVVATITSGGHATAPAGMPGEKVTTFKPIDLADRPSHEPPPEPVKLVVHPAPAMMTSAMPAPLIAGTQPIVPEIVEILLANGVDPDIADKTGWTALMRAAAFGEERVARLLIANGADTKLKNAEGKTAADLARENGFPKLASML